MGQHKGKLIIQGLQKKWTIRILLSHMVFALAITLLLSSFAIKVFQSTWVIIPLIFVVLVLIVFQFLYKKISEEDVAQFLNKALPQLQESTSLLLKPYDNMNILEKLQLNKIEEAIEENVPEPITVDRKLKIALIFFVLASVIAAALFLIPSKYLGKQAETTASGTDLKTTKPETKLPQVDELNLRISPPAYTRKGTRAQSKFNLVAEEGATLLWNITTTSVVKGVDLIFNDKSVIKLKATNKTNTSWSATKLVRSPGFYQVKIAGALSELYKIEIIKDKFPSIVVKSPKPNTVIESGQAQRTLLEVSITDDYGIRSTYISATIASGSGEAVKFKEQQLSFSNFVPGNSNYQLQKQVDLGALGMKPGDELYFYITATDSYNQEKRSDIYIVRIEDTTQLMSMEGLASGIDIKPAFFRSQRQIIIETEQLLRDRDTIAIEEFKKRSNDLGVDQKLLRLRYGKFLGEETDAEIGNDHEHEEEGHNDAEDFGNAQKMIDEVSHKHDNAEDATFFDAATKKQLKATLAEMWKSELQLRTNKPTDALPFEYKALKLLKELQQQTRVYVAKTGIKTTPLKPEKRLTGELDKITPPFIQQNFQQKAHGTITLRKALGVLEQIRNKEVLQRPSIEILEQASMQLSTKAATEPGAYLTSLEALRRILRNNYKPKDIAAAGSGLQRMIKTSLKLPQQSARSADMKLSERYFMNLNRRND
ncbi:MAG: hypothetical protein JWQ96_2119 [Segetibacter sp.]|nr:hypothetical protein [Segetibacter sp.]